MKHLQLRLLPASLLSLASLSASSAFAQEPPSLPAVEIAGRRAPVVVDGGGQTAAKMDVSNLDVPQSVEVRTTDLMRDFGLQRLDAVARTVAGVGVGWNGNGGSDAPFLVLRGFPNTGAVLVNGYRRTGGYYNVMDGASIDRVEFLKGPSSVLYGSTGSLGGAVNYVSKRPTRQAAAAADLTLGSWASRRTTFDLGAPLGGDGALSLRLTGSAESEGSFARYAHSSGEALSPGLALDFGDGSRLTLLTDVVRSRLTPSFGLPITPAYRQIPIDTYIQEPSFDRSRAVQSNVLLEYERPLSADCSLVLGYSRGRGDWHSHYTYVWFDDREADPLTLARQPNYEHFITVDSDLEGRVEGRVSGFGLEHHLVLGLGLTTTVSRGDDQVTFDNFPALDLRHPVYGGVLSNPSVAGRSDSRTTTIAPYAQDLITLAPGWKAMLGLRYDRVRQHVVYRNFWGSSSDSRQSDRKASPRAGLVWQPQDDVAYYLGYSTSFSPTLGSNSADECATAPFEPESGRQLELGMKRRLHADLGLNVALYQLERRNLLAQDPAHPRCQIQTGLQRSRGLEVDLNGRPARGTTVSFAFAWMKAEVVRDDDLPAGTERIGVPRLSGNLALTQELDAWWPGVTVGTNLYAASRTQAEMPNSFRIGRQVQVDLMASWRVDAHWRLQANVKNVFDRRNEVASDVGYITPGTPRAVQLTLGTSF